MAHDMKIPVNVWVGPRECAPGTKAQTMCK